MGYRINGEFVRNYFGRVFLHPDVIFTEEMLRPELQDPKTFADSVDVIVTTHKVVADRYFADGSLEQACPPLRALLEIMHDGVSREGWHLDSPEFRALFERENILLPSGTTPAWTPRLSVTASTLTRLTLPLRSSSTPLVTRV